MMAYLYRENRTMKVTSSRASMAAADVEEMLILHMPTMKIDGSVEKSGEARPSRECGVSQ